MKRKNSDIRRGDLVKFKRNIVDDDAERIRTFAKNISKQPEMYDYASEFIDSLIDGELKSSVVWKCAQTKKGTDYACLTSPCGEDRKHCIYVPVQARYLTLVHRKPSHPLTTMFQDR